MDLDGYSRRAEAFNSRVAREYYRHFAGLNGAFEPGPAYDRHAALFETETIDCLRALADDASPARARRARALMRFAVEGSLGMATAALDGELARLEATVSVAVPAGGPDRGVDRLSLSETLTALAEEPDPQRRAELDRARRRVLDEVLNPLATEALERRHAHARQLGWDSYAHLCAELSEVDLDDLEHQAEAFLSATAEAYRAALEEPAREVLGITATNLRRCDLPVLLRNRQADGGFPADRLIPALQDTLGALGLGLRPNVVLDVERRPGKSARAFCVPVRVPQEIYLVLAPVGGRADYRALLHETGHAQHFAGSDGTLPFELRRLGDPAVGEAFAFLFEGLVDEPVWRQRQLGLGDEGAGRDHARAQRLLLLRRYAAKLGYERELHQSESPLGPCLQAAYARRLSDALRVPWPGESWLSDVDPGMYVISYVRGWALASGLRHALVQRYGTAWFEQRAAGELLRRLWREGQRLRAEELLALVDAEARMRFDSLAQEFAP